MASLIGTTVRFLGGGALVFAAAYLASDVRNPVSPELKTQVSRYRARRPLVEAVSVGNSHASTLDFPALGMQGMHFSGSSQDPFESAYLARYAMDGAPRLRYVFMSASYGLQRIDHAVPAGIDQRAKRRLLYARVPFRGPMPGDIELWFAGLLSPVVRDDHWAGVFWPPLVSAPPVRLTGDGRVLYPQRRPLTPDELTRYGVRVAEQHAVSGNQTVAAAPATPARVAATLDTLARDLGARGVSLVLYMPPYHESYRRTQDPAILAATRAMLDTIAARHANVAWLDYSADQRFVGWDSLFRNSDHLNEAGGRQLSGLMRECLRARGTSDVPARAGCPAPAR